MDDNLRLGIGHWALSIAYFPHSLLSLTTTDIERVNLCEFSLWVVLGSLVFI
jgi:hypothetical protein